MNQQLFLSVTNAPAVFQAVINQVFSKYLNWFVCTYLDDILVSSCTEAEHYEHLNTVMQTVQAESLKASVKKCDFFKSELVFLGHVVAHVMVLLCHSSVVVLHAIHDWAFGISPVTSFSDEKRPAHTLWAESGPGEDECRG